MTTPDRRPLTDALISALGTGTGRPVGDHQSPPSPVAPYCIVYASDGAELSGPALWHPEEDGAFPFLIRSVGLRRDQAEWMADRVRLTILGRSGKPFQIAIAAPLGWTICDRLSGSGPSVPVPEGIPPNQVWNVSEHYVLKVTPS